MNHPSIMVWAWFNEGWGQFVLTFRMAYCVGVGLWLPQALQIKRRPAQPMRLVRSSPQVGTLLAFFPGRRTRKTRTGSNSGWGPTLSCLARVGRSAGPKGLEFWRTSAWITPRPSASIATQLGIPSRVTCMRPAWSGTRARRGRVPNSHRSLSSSARRARVASLSGRIRLTCFGA